MASSTFAITNSAIALSGPWDDGYAASAQCKICFARYGTIDFVATGTDCTLRYAIAGAVTVQVSVDGGAFTTLTNPGTNNTYADVTLFSGLTDTSHTITIRQTSTSSPLFYVDYQSAVTVTGAAPAISASSPFSGATIYRVADLYGLGAMDGAWNAMYQTGFSFGYQRPSGVTAKNVDASIRFVGNPTAIAVFCQINSAGFRVYQDGVAVGSKVVASAANTNPASSASTMGWVELASGLDGASHTYHIVNCDTNAAGVFAVKLTGGTLDRSSPFSRRGAIAVLGDSLTAGLSGTSNDSTLSYGFKLGLLKDRPTLNGGLGSTFLMSDPARSTEGASLRYTDATLWVMQGQPPDYVIVLIGVNDINATTAPDTTVFRRAYNTMLSGIRKTVGADCKILALGITPTTATNANSRRSTYNAEVSGAVSDQADVNTTYISTDTLWGTGGAAPTNTQINNNTTDGLHPTGTGYDALVTLLSPHVTTWTESDGGSGGGGLILGGNGQTGIGVF